MQYGRQISPYDKDILKELKNYWKDSVKIDFDILHEPCIFYNYHGAWNVVYKLSRDGSYIEKKLIYVQNAHNAIFSFIREQRKISYEQEKQYQENFHKKREEIKKDGFKDAI